jgi:hypothetical protein
MRRTAVIFGLIAGLAIGAVAAAAGIASASAPAPARVFVSAKEFSLILSRTKLKPGSAKVQLYNAGEDAHDLRLKRVGGTRTLSVAETEPGKVSELKAMLRSGTWKLWCSLPGHAQAGMRATLRVHP